MINQKLIEKQKNIALSGKQVLKLVNYKAKIIRYPELHTYGTLEDCLMPYGAFFLLYEAQPMSGHWCCVTLSNGVVTFFDPYGGAPDSQLNHIDLNFRKQSNQYYPLLTKLLNECPYKVTWNKTQFQNLVKGVRDCGRWCSMRILMKDMTNKQFTYLFKSKDSDDLITYLTL